MKGSQGARSRDQEAGEVRRVPLAQEALVADHNRTTPQRSVTSVLFDRIGGRKGLEEAREFFLDLVAAWGNATFAFRQSGKCGFWRMSD